MRQAREEAEMWKQRCSEVNKTLLATKAQMEDFDHKCLIMEKKMKRMERGLGGTVMFIFIIISVNIKLLLVQY